MSKDKKFEDFIAYLTAADIKTSNEKKKTFLCIIFQVQYAGWVPKYMPS